MPASPSLSRLLRLGLLLGVLAPWAQAQTTSLSGIVRDGETGSALPGASVLLAGADTLGQAADLDGAFAFSDLAPGRYALTISSVGFETFADTLDLAPGEDRRMPVALLPQPAELQNVTVEAPVPTVGPVGVTRLRPADFVALPTPDPGGDLASVLTAQPGVVAVGDRGGQLYIRGGLPTENLVLVDGMRVFQPFHLVGFYSAFPADIVQHADVYAGGFGARYGGRISSVIDITTRNGSKRRFQGSATAAPFLTAVHLSGPISRDNVSFVASARESVIERLGEAVLGEPFPYRFGDAFGKIHARLSPTAFFTASGLTTHDEGRLSGSASEGNRVSWDNRAAAGRFFYMPPTFAAALDLSVFYSTFDARFEPDFAPPRRSAIESFGGEFALDYFLGATEVRFGFSSQTILFDFAFDDRGGTGGLTEEAVTEGSAFGIVTLDLGAVQLEPSLRVQLFPSQTREASVEPRLRAAWTPIPNQTFSVAAGQYRQEILGLTDLRDVGDVFVAWAPVPRGRPLPSATHLVGGWKGQIGSSLAVSAEAYAKDLRGMAVRFGNEGIVFTDGTVAGVDLQASWTQGLFGADVGYGFTDTEFVRDGFAFRPPHDRPHRLSVSARLQGDAWRASVRWQVASGRPFTPVAGRYHDLDPLAPDFLTQTGEPIVVPSATVFSARTPAYHRLDVSVERAFRLPHARLVVQGGLLNAYDRANFFYFDALRGDRVDQFPLLPIVGLRLELD